MEYSKILSIKNKYKEYKEAYIKYLKFSFIDNEGKLIISSSLLDEYMMKKYELNNLLMYYNNEKEYKDYIDNADSYICPICGNEIANPNKYENNKCPICGFEPKCKSKFN